ncbi:MAG: exonuclease SbcCD subunit D [Lachnospiraceae bacterium]|nr:exonuclease SbcCD subunit D [Lachnospiraceae bacterium]
MKILHTADLHIGKILNEISLLEDQRYILTQIVQAAREEKVDAVILAGDIYDRAVPPAEAVLVFNEFMLELSSLEIPVFIISGNHDSAERLNYASDLLKVQNIYIKSLWDGKLEAVQVADGYGTVNFYMLPFARDAVMRHLEMQTQPPKQEEVVNEDAEGTDRAQEEMDSGSEVSFGRKTQDFLQEVLNDSKVDYNERNVLITHHFVAGNIEDIEQSDSERDTTVGGTNWVESALFRDFDYVALGHIHHAQNAGAPHIRYAGSPLKYSFSEALHEKSVTIIEMKEKGDIDISERKLTPLHDLRHIKGMLSQVVSPEIVAEGAEDYLMVTLTDKEEIFSPLERLRSVYPNLMTIQWEKNLGDREGVDAPDKERIRKKRNILDLYREFYEKVTGAALDEKQMDVLKKMTEEADETD